MKIKGQKNLPLIFRRINMVTTMSGITGASGLMTNESILSTDVNVLLLFIIALQIVQLFVLIRGVQNGN
jgi:hypothetical protein